MLKNYLTIAIRNLMRHKLYSAINLAGLAIGIAVCMLIFLWVQDELSYDRFHENADRIYRVVLHSGRPYHVAPAPMGPALVRDFPQVVDAVRLFNLGNALVQHGETQFYERITFADPNILKMFSFSLQKGDPKTALNGPNQILLTEHMAQKYFGSEDPVGKTLELRARPAGGWFTVTGVLNHVPQNTHIKFDFLASFASLEERVRHLDQWAPSNYPTYLLLAEGADPAELEAAFPAWRASYVDVLSSWYLSALSLQRLTDIHLYVEDHIVYVFAFTAIAALILLMACVNFMNLSTARSAMRAKEVGLRRVVGAHRLQLIGQFMGESILLSCLAVLLAVAAVEWILPAFQALVHKDLSPPLLNISTGVPILLGVALFVGLLAGTYPAFFLSAFEPVTALKGGPGAVTGRTGFRSALVVVQFAISIVLIAGTGTVYTQITYMKNKKLGLEAEQVVVISNIKTAMPPLAEIEKQRYQTFKEEILNHPNVLSAAFSSGRPARWYQGGWAFQAEGLPERQSIASFIVDADFIETLGLELRAGRNFEAHAKAGEEEFMLNETAVRELLEMPSPMEAIGMRVNWSGNWGRIVGVVKDFHIDPAHRRIQPLLMVANPRFRPYEPINLLVKVRPENISKTLSSLEHTWKAFAPAHPFTFSFLDEDFDRLYQSEERLGKIFATFASLAILIACLGLFGLAAFTAQQRTREIGVRKVLGASASGIVLMLSKDFVKLVLIANLIAWPVAYYAMSRWLENFAYRINLGWEVFVLSGGLALFIALLTVSGQAWQAARANPVDALRNE